MLKQTTPKTSPSDVSNLTEEENGFTMTQKASKEPGCGWFGDVHDYFNVESVMSGRRGAGIMLFHAARQPPTAMSTLILLVQKKNGRQGPPKGGAHKGESPFCLSRI